MSVTIETLEKLERKVPLTVSVEDIQTEVSKRLRKAAKQAKLDGFRPGKVPMHIVEQRYGYSIQNEVLNDKVSQAFSDAVTQAKIRVIGQPKITEAEAKVDGHLAFDAVFEVAPEVSLDGIAKVKVEKIVEPVIEETAIERTLDILRKQYRTFVERAKADAVEKGNKVTLDFEGKVEGELFDGGKSEGFQFIVGDGQMLKEFDDAVLGMKLGDSKTFPLAFPADYHGKEVAGKQADFMVTIKKIEAEVLPEIDEKLIKSLGIADGSLETLRADIVKNLTREVKNRTLAANKGRVMEALAAGIEFDLPKASVDEEIHRLVENQRNELRERGMPDVEKIKMPEDIFKARAEQRVRLGFILSELVVSKKLTVTDEQVQAYVNEMAASYEQPEELINWYNADKKRLADVANIVLENNVVDFVLSQAKVTEKPISFDELMAAVK